VLRAGRVLELPAGALAASGGTWLDDQLVAEPVLPSETSPGWAAGTS
jgi:hypothetical protein